MISCCGSGRRKRHGVDILCRETGDPKRESQQLVLGEGGCAQTGGSLVSPLPQSLDPARHVDPGALSSCGQPFRVERGLHCQRLQPHSPGLAEAPFLCVNKRTAS